MMTDTDDDADRRNCTPLGLSQKTGLPQGTVNLTRFCCDCESGIPLMEGTTCPDRLIDPSTPARQEPPQSRHRNSRAAWREAESSLRNRDHDISGRPTETTSKMWQSNLPWHGSQLLEGGETDLTHLCQPFCR